MSVCLSILFCVFQRLPLCWENGTIYWKCSQNASAVAASDLQVVLKINNRFRRVNTSNHLLPTALQRQKKTSYKTRQMCFSNLRSFFPSTCFAASVVFLHYFPSTSVRHRDALMHGCYLDRFHNPSHRGTYKDLRGHKQLFSYRDDTLPIRP